MVRHVWKRKQASKARTALDQGSQVPDEEAMHDCSDEAEHQKRIKCRTDIIQNFESLMTWAYPEKRKRQCSVAKITLDLEEVHKMNRLCREC